MHLQLFHSLSRIAGKGAEQPRVLRQYATGPKASHHIPCDKGYGQRHGTQSVPYCFFTEHIVGRGNAEHIQRRAQNIDGTADNKTCFRAIDQPYNHGYDLNSGQGHQPYT